MTLRVRAQDADGDFVFGAGPKQWLVDSPDAVAQCARTRLELWEEEWFLDLSDGTPYRTMILGEGTLALYDQAIRERLLATPGVISFEQYASTLAGRMLQVVAKLNTQFGEAPLVANANVG